MTPWTERQVLTLDPCEFGLICLNIYFEKQGEPEELL